jgi:hypothetical protein
MRIHGAGAARGPSGQPHTWLPDPLPAGGSDPEAALLDKQQGELKDVGLRALLRRFAAMPPGGISWAKLVVLTSRQAVKDITRWKDSTAMARASTGRSIVQSRLCSTEQA